jgi:hypothetical protein
MSKPAFRTLALTLIALGMATVPSSANEDKTFDEVQIQKMFDKLRLAVIGTSAEQKYTYMSLTTLGIPIREGFSETNPGDLELLEQQFDFIPRKAPLYTRSTLKYSDVYGHILNDRRLVLKSLLTDEQKEGKTKAQLATLEKQVREQRKKQIETLTKDLDPTSDDYKAYLAAKTDQNTANNALRVAKNLVDQANSNLSLISGINTGKPGSLTIADAKALLELKKPYQDAVNIANSDLASAKEAKTNADTAFLQVKGPDFEAKIGKLYTLQNYNGEAWWKGLRGKFDAAKVGATGDSYDIKFFPAASEWNPVGSNKEQGDPWPDESKAYAGLPGPIDSTGKELLPNAPAPTVAVTPPPPAPDPSDPPADATADTAQPVDSGSESPAATDPGAPAPAPSPAPAAARSGGSGGYPRPAVDPGWVTFTFKHEDVTNGTRSSAEANSFSASCNAVFYSGGGGHSDNTAIQTASTVDKSFKMTVQLKLVSVFRPWMDMTVFRNNSWVIGRKIWRVDGKISYGLNPKPSGAVEPLMPMYVDTLILAKNLVLEGTDLSLQANAIQAASESHFSASYGCFNVSGAHSDAHRDTNSHKLVNATKINAPGVQIIGVLSSVMDECPSAQLRTSSR